jgi:hypothetical protein
MNFNNKIITDGLVLCLDAADIKSYPGSGTIWYDRTKNKYNGTLTNGPTFSSDNGGAIVFDGTNDYVTCSNTIPNSLTALSLEIIIKIGKTGSKQGLLGTYNTGAGWGLEFINTNLFNFFGFQSAGVYTDVQTTSASTLNSICHVVGTFAASNSCKIYLNGALNNTKNSTNTSWNKTAGEAIRLGDDADAQSIYFQGNIYLARIYTKALSDAEVLQNFNAQRKRFNV